MNKKFIAISDLHGILPDYSKYPCDAFLICGDISPLKAQHNIPQMINWIIKRFVPWAQNLPCERVFLIGGNHDTILERNVNPNDLFRQSKIVYLKDELYCFDGIRIYGTPWCKVFGNWSFMLTPEGLNEKYAMIPDHVDILMTHDVPYGRNDICEENIWWNSKEHIGNHELLNIVEEKKPKIHCCGHLHSTLHDPTQFGDTIQYNCSIVNEQYKYTYKPQEFEL